MTSSDSRDEEDSKDEEDSRDREEEEEEEDEDEEEEEEKEEEEQPELMDCDVVWYGTKDSSDVVVHLVAASTQVSVDLKQKKRKREEDLESLLEIHVHSDRLCQCSNYFDKALRERRAQESHKTPDEFSLEVCTEVSYYKDCFSRMYTPFTPISSVKYCIELLRVAAKIEFQKVVDLCVRYLTAVPWTVDEEQKIREYVRTAEFPSDSATDLLSRLELLVPTKDRYTVLSKRILSTMVGYLTKSVTNDKTKIAYKKRFQDVFDEIMSGSCYSLREDALTVVNQEAKRLLQCVEHKSPDSEQVFRAVCDFQWLFKLCKTAFAAQLLVEAIVENRGVSRFLKTFRSQICGACRFYEPEWTDLILSIFEDVLTGVYFLKTSARITFFEDWQWLLEDAMGRPHFRSRVKFITDNFVTSFPHVQQEAIFGRWMSSGSATKRLLEFESAHSKWINNAVKNVSPSEKEYQQV